MLSVSIQYEKGARCILSRLATVCLLAFPIQIHVGSANQTIQRHSSCYTLTAFVTAAAASPAVVAVVVVVVVVVVATTASVSGAGSETVDVRESASVGSRDTGSGEGERLLSFGATKGFGMSTRFEQVPPRPRPPPS